MDPFASLGEKYRFLLQIPAGARVLVAGEYWSSLLDDLRAAGMDARPFNQRGASAQALFVEVNGWRQRTLPSVARSLGPSATLVVLRRRGLAPDAWSRQAIHRLARRTGLHVAAEFIPVPRIEAPEAFLATTVEVGAWLFGRSRLARLLSQDAPQDRLFILGRRPGVAGLTEAAHLLERASGEQGFTVERFHLRRRGALVMVLRGPGEVGRVLRIATNPQVAALARRNQEVTRALHQSAALPDGVKVLIPRPLGTATDDSVEACAETLVPGRLAWMLYRDPDSRARIDHDLYHFSHRLQTATCRRVHLEGDTLAGLVGGYLDPIEHRLGKRAGIGERLLAIRRRLHGLLEGRVFPLASAHGDFGVGNALAMPDGAVSAIIDWDQFIPLDAVGVDWCDYQFKADHFRETLFDGLPRRVREATASGWLAPRYTGFGASDLGLTRTDMAIVPCLAVLRDLTRSAGFPAELQKPDQHYTRLLDLVGQSLPGQS